MKKINRLIIAAVLLLPTPAFAYLDPGTGSMILQGLIAGIAVVGTTIKLYWHRILALFGKKTKVAATSGKMKDSR